MFVVLFCLSYFLAHSLAPQYVHGTNQPIDGTERNSWFKNTFVYSIACTTHNDCVSHSQWRARRKRENNRNTIRNKIANAPRTKRERVRETEEKNNIYIWVVALLVVFVLAQSDFGYTQCALCLAYECHQASGDSVVSTSFRSVDCSRLLAATCAHL